MIVRDQTSVSFPILFSTGAPAGDVDWEVRDAAGLVLGSGSITPPLTAVSINLPVDASYNTLSGADLLDHRDVEWVYTTAASEVVNGAARYTIEARLPVGISVDGVRMKLGGVSKVDLPDSDISLVKAYLTFENLVSTFVLNDVFDGGLIDIRVRDAVEALAARALIPTMPVRVASSEDSGTNSFKRQEIDWDAVALHLDGIVNDGVLAVNPAYDQTVDFGSLLIVVTPATDAVTGATN